MKASAFKWWLIAVLLLAFGARVYRIDHQSFWNDEGNSASLSSRSVRLILEGTASDVHPPLYYLLLRGWRPLAGKSDLALRMVSAVAGMIQVAATIAIGRLWLSRNGTIAVGLLMALSPPLVYYSQEARMYALLGAIATCSMWVILRSQKSEIRSRKLGAVVFAVLTTLGLYTHYVYPAVIVAQGLIVVLLVGAKHAFDIHKIWDGARLWLVAVLAALVAYGPWIPIFLRTGSSTREAGSLGAVDFLQQTAFWLILGPFPFLSEGWLIAVIFTGVAMLAAVLALTKQKFRLPVAAASMMLLIPVLLMWFVGATDDGYRKFLTGAVPAVWLLVVLGVDWLDQLWPKLNGRGSNALWSMLFILFGLLPALVSLYTNPATFRDDYRGIAQLIEAEGRENGAVILNAPNQWEVFTWYAGDSGPQTLYPMPKSRRPDVEIVQEVETVLAQHDFVYVLFWGFEGFDPNRIVERTLDERAFKSTDQWYGDVRLVTYGVLADFLPSEANLPDLELGEEFLLPNDQLGSGVWLNWVETSGLEFQPGDVIGLAFEWEALRDVDGRYKVFIHLLDDDGNLVAQRDSEPVGNLKPTDGWQAGEVVLDQHGLLIPAGTPAGEYQLVMGLYDVRPPNQRLVVELGESDEKTADFILVQTIRIK